MIPAGGVIRRIAVIRSDRVPDRVPRRDEGHEQGPELLIQLPSLFIAPCFIAFRS